MAIRQVSVFLENRPGQLAEVTRLLSENEINLRAINVAEVADYGIIRLITNHTTKTKDLLLEYGFVAQVSEVVCAIVPDKPGGLNETLGIIADAGLDIEYMYSILGNKSDKSYMIIKVDDIEKAEKILSEKNMAVSEMDDLGIHQ